ncbi:MAG TPA: glycosyltransferase family 4 protein [Acidimicrobiales bacterium]|nr:glycosyltransferase family 4 protein [Acidimicrobiales bacterium]
MKVLYLITVLAPAGAEQSLVAMAPSLARRGVRLHVAYLRDRPGTVLPQQLQKAGVEVSSLVGLGGPIRRLRRIVQLVRRHHPDVIHTTLTEANLLGRVAGALTRTPVVSSLVNVSYGPEQRAAPGSSRLGLRLRHLLDLLTVRRVVRFHAVTHLVAEVMAPRLGIPLTRVEVVPRGREPELLGRRSPERRARARQSLDVEDRTPLVVSVAHQDYQKGHDVLLEAMARVREERSDVRLVVAGRPGNHTAVLQEMVDRLDLQPTVHFLGLRHDVADLLCAADAFVLASRWEGMGGVLLEAMALQAPIVVSDLPTLREAIPDERYAMFVPPEQPTALASAILDTLAHPTGAAERATRARQRFLDHFTVDRVAERMVDFYEHALAATGSPHSA